MSITKEEFH